MLLRPHLIEKDFAGSSQETAILLVGTAREFGIPQWEIAMDRGGFRISDRLHSVLYDEGVFDTKTSGNRAEEKQLPKEKP